MGALAEVLYFCNCCDKKTIGLSGPIIGFLCTKIKESLDSKIIFKKINILMDFTLENKVNMTL